MKLTCEGLTLIKEFEFCKLRAYQDIRGLWTIGYGRTHGVKPEMTCTQEQADQWLMDDVEAMGKLLAEFVPSTLNDNQFSACLCLVYNIGIGNFRKSQLAADVNNGFMKSAADRFLDWDHCDGKVIPGLYRRRSAERALFLKAS